MVKNSKPKPQVQPAVKLGFKETTPLIEPERDISLLTGLIGTVSTAPTHIPKKFDEQVVVFKSGATKRLYIYDNINNEWDFVALT